MMMMMMMMMISLPLPCAAIVPVLFLWAFRHGHDQKRPNQQLPPLSPTTTTRPPSKSNPLRLSRRWKLTPSEKRRASSRPSADAWEDPPRQPITIQRTSLRRKAPRLRPTARMPPLTIKRRRRPLRHLRSWTRN